MNIGENRTIEELVVRYELEPTLRDIYTEGAFDATVVNWILKEAGCHNAAVYEINTVEIAHEVLARHGLDDGNKGRVIALCVELRSHISPPNQVSGIVDRDYDLVLRKTYSSDILLFTDYSCMEMYFFDTASLGRFCHFFLRTNRELPAKLITSLTPVLQDLFFIRATNESRKLHLSWLEVDKQCSIKKGFVEFDSDAFVDKYLNKNARMSEKESFAAELQVMRTKTAGDHRHRINGHDFVHLLAKYAHSLTKNKNLADPEVVERALVGYADYRQLADQPMFRTLIQRVS